MENIKELCSSPTTTGIEESRNKYIPWNTRIIVKFQRLLNLQRKNSKPTYFQYQSLYHALRSIQTFCLFVWVGFFCCCFCFLLNSKFFTFASIFPCTIHLELVHINRPCGPHILKGRSTDLLLHVKTMSLAVQVCQLLTQ